jgi:methylmalonyl-CoA mutase N-terminal domain/subunit
VTDPQEVAKARQAWETNVVNKTLAKNPERKKTFETTSGIAYERAFTPDSIADLDYNRDLSFPGSFPYTRGVQPTMYRGRLWTMRQYAGFGTAEESNKRYRYLLDNGTTGLSVAFDLPTQMGYDSDHAMAKGEVGKVGVAIDTLADMETLFDQIPLDKVSTSMTINATASTLLALYVAVGEKQGFSSDKLSGTIQNDILKEYIARGTYIYPPQGSLRIITDIFAFCKTHVPKWNTISISGYHIREAGSTAVQEVAFTLADGITYVEAALKAGLDVDEFAGRLAFFFNGHNDFLEEIAKYRAARRLWAKIMKERFKAKKESSLLLRFHTQTAGSTLTAQQPDNNIVRVTLQALAAVLGGTQSLHTNSRDEALALPTEESVRIALRTQQIIAEESGVANTIDPLAGSYAIEKLTSEIEQRALDYIEKIDAMGGMITAIEKGYPQKELQDAAYRYQREIESQDRIIVGVNRYRVDEKPPEGLLKVDPQLEVQQVAKLKHIKATRDNDAVKRALAALEAAARGSDNVMPKILDCVRVYASLGEISDAMRNVYGEYEESVVL